MDRSLAFSIAYLAALLASGCGSSSNPGSGAVISANIKGASFVGRYRSWTANGAAADLYHSLFRAFNVTVTGLNVDSKGSVLEDQDTVVVDPQTGAITKVFEEVSIPIYAVQDMPNDVIINGPFINLLDTSGSPFNCYLMAISKADNSIYCISPGPVGMYSADLIAQNFANTYSAYSRLGWAIRGSTIYYVDNSTNTLNSWTEGATTNTLVYTDSAGDSGLSQGGDGMEDVMLDQSSPSATNICILNNAVNSFPGDLLCGDPVGGFSNVTLNAAVLAETQQIGNLVVSTDQVVNLNTLAVSSRNVGDANNGALPTSNSVNVVTANGGLLGVGYNQSLVYVDSGGNSYAFSGSPSLFSQQLFSISNTSAWVVASTTQNNGSNNPTLNILFRVGLDSASLATYITNTTSGSGFGYTTFSNQIAAAGMDSITSMSLSGNGQIQLEGLDSGGDAVTAFIDSSDTITVASTPVQSLDQMVSVSH